MATITLYSDYPFVQGGHHVPYFNTDKERNSFLQTLSYQTFTNVDYEPREGARLQLPITLNEARTYNYCQWTSDDDTHTIFFFVEGYVFLNDHPTTQLIISRDVWMSTGNLKYLNPCTVHRMHMPRWNGNTPLFYPVEEGNPRSLTPQEQHVLDGSAEAVYSDIALIVTNKNLNSEAHEDGIYYYLSFAPTIGYRLGAGSGTSWVNPFAPSFISEFSKFGVGLNPIVGAYLLPNGMSFVNSVSLTDGSFKSQFGTKITTDTAALFHYNGTTSTSTFNISISDRPTRNTNPTAGAQSSYEPMCYLDNLRPAYITDMLGYPVMSLPKNIILTTSPVIDIHNRIFSLNPQIALHLRTTVDTYSPATGLTALIGSQGIDIPQSTYYDYVAQRRSQDKNILENNIRSRYIQTAVSAGVSALSGGTQGAMFAEAYGNRNTTINTAGVAGASGGAISGIGSLVNSYIQAGVDRDNFRLNEQKIKNTPTPPIAGDNPQMANGIGIGLILMKADQPTIDTVFSQYHYYGYILDKAMAPSLIPNRYYYTYIQTKDANVTGRITQDDRNYLQTLLNRGVTIWNMKNWVGFSAYQYDNVEV